MFCFGIQHGKEGVGLVFEANGSTTSVVRDVQERGSKTVRRSNGDTYSAWGDMVWRDFETITTTSSSVTQNRIEIEYVVRIRGSWEGQNGKLERFDDEYSPSKIILEISRSGCKLVERVFSLSRVKYRVKSSTCRIVW